MKLSVKEIKKIVAEKKSDRSNWEALWQDIGDYIFTRKSQVITKRTSGEDLQFHLYDNTGPQALELFAGIMMSIMMSVEEPWLEFSSGDVEIDQRDDVKKYLQKVSRVIHSVLANSNFYTEAHEMLLDVGGFGTNVFGIEEDPEEVVRFFAKFIGEAYIGENARGKVDEIFMEYEWNPRQLLSEYGEDALPKEVKEALSKDQETEKKFKVIIGIYPVDRHTNKPNEKGHTYFSHHVMPDLNHELKVGGFNSFPYPTPRFSKATGEIYGRSPAMVALPEVKVLNKMVEVTLAGAEKVMDPPLQAPDDGFITQINTFPGSISFYRAGGNDRIQPVFNDTRVDFGIQLIQEKQGKVRDAFYINQMMIQPKSGNPATAMEISQQVEQSMRFMGSFLARMQKEFLQPTGDRVVDILFKRGVLLKEEIPEILRGRKFIIRYTSFIARAQRVGTLQNIQRFFAAIEPLVQADPSNKFYLNGSGGIKTIAGILGTPIEMLNSEEDVNKMKEAAAQAQAEAMKAEQQNNQLDSVAKAAAASSSMQG